MVNSGTVSRSLLGAVCSLSIVGQATRAERDRETVFFRLEGHAVSTGGEFFKMPKHITERRDLGSTSKILYSVLLSRQGTNGRSWAGVRRLAKDCGVSVGAIIRSATEMEALGLLEIVRGGTGRNNQYRIRFGSAPEMEALPKWKRSAPEMEALSAPKMEAQLEQVKRPIKENPPKPPLAGQGGGPPRRRRRMTKLEQNIERFRRLGMEEERQKREAEERQKREAEERQRAAGGGST